MLIAKDLVTKWRFS